LARDLNYLFQLVSLLAERLISIMGDLHCPRPCTPYWLQGLQGLLFF